VKGEQYMNSKYLGPDRREFTRIKLSLSALYNFVKEPFTEDLSKKRAGTMCTLSAKGIGLEIKTLDETFLEDLYKGMMKIGIIFSLEEGPPIKALAKMSWITKTVDEENGEVKYVMGLEFTDITTQNIDTIKTFIINTYLRDRI